MPVRLLDYPCADIRLQCETQVEETKRVVAVKKERETVDWIHGFSKESVFFDVGACVGAYSFIAASQGHRVVAFEPAAMNYARLVENCTLNPHLNVLVLPFLLSWKTGMTYFGYSSLEPGSALHVTGSLSTDDWAQVQVGWALDDLLSHSEIGFPQPTALKIDTDGHELSVLKGAQETLRRVQTLLVELDTTCKDSELIEPLLTIWGFSVKSRHRHGETSISNVIFER